MPLQTQTILFTDIVASTELFSVAGGTRTEDLLRAHFELLDDHVRHHGGRPIKRLGDGVMARFGAATAAIGAAVAIQQTVTCGTVEHPGGGGLRLRVAMSSGDVHLEGDDCLGAPVVEASRLCERAEGAQILVAERTRLLVGPRVPLADRGSMRLKGLRESINVWEAIWEPGDRPPLRAVIADDAAFVREGVARVLEACGIDVVAQVGDAEQLLRLTDELLPDIAVIDLRMPPTHTSEGIDAAEQILARHTLTSVLLLSQDLEPRYAERLRQARAGGVGYLLKQRVADIRVFQRSVHRVAQGELVFDDVLSTPSTNDTTTYQEAQQ